MLLTVYKKNIFWGFLSIVIMLFFTLYTNLFLDKLSVYNQRNWCKEISFFLLVLFATQIILLKLISIKGHYIILVAFILFYLFNFSHIILNGLNYDFGSNYRNNVFFRFDSFYVKESTLVLINASIFLFIGYTIFYLLHYKEYTDGDKEGVNFNNINPMLCAALIVIGGIFDLYFSFTTLRDQITGGYYNVDTSTMSYLVKVMSYLLLPGIILYVTNVYKSTGKKKLVMTLFVVYKFLTMLSGLRAYALISILIVTYIYFKYNVSSRLRIRDIILILILLQLIGGFLVGIRETRRQGIDIAIIIKYMFDIKSNIIFNVMAEFGISQNVICEILKEKNGIATGGSQLILSFLTIIPFVRSIFPGIDFDKGILETALNIHNYGGNYVGDLLFDFGRSGLLIASVTLGVFFAFIYEKFEDKIDGREYSYIAIAAPIIVEFIYSVRSSLAKMPRMIVWFLIIVLLIKLVVNSVFKEKMQCPRTSDSADIIP